MERSTAILEHLAACHFGSADAALDLDLDALGSNPHGSSDCHLDGPSVGHTAFDLTGDGVSYDSCIRLRTTNLEDVDLDVLLRYLLELFLELLDFLSALSDDDTGPCSLDGHGNELEGPLDDDPGKACLGETLLEIFADLVVFSYLLRIVTTDPVGVPTTGDADSVANWICLLSHDYASAGVEFSAGALAASAAGFLTSRMMVTWLERLRILPALPRGIGRSLFSIRPSSTMMVLT